MQTSQENNFFHWSGLIINLERGFITYGVTVTKQTFKFLVRIMFNDYSSPSRTAFEE